jgi:hypothetical protein
LPWSIDSETGVLTDVLLSRPEHYQWIETNAIAVQTLASGRWIDAQRLQGEFRQLEDALDHAGARRHYIEPEPHLPYQVYTRDSSQTTPWGPSPAGSRTRAGSRSSIPSPNISFTSTSSSAWQRPASRWPASRSWATISPTG